ncbi:Histone H3 K4-specific methyltransferase SET7/9 family protein [Prunus dulcis]|uniref:Histone H3 K4-specific methyltransferase SET7/9 family protein n=1 Tax=Prunus dulcis TaxID=3755 RepID=A0A4Y1QUV4_PRUDU|nr:Histone H3 K4-specific methyltransferase SET7/9 family protein [Prunus dulcis]
MVPKSQAKLTRTQSSLLRSSPTIRSSIHSLSSVTEEDVIVAQQQQYDEEEQKPKNYNPGSTQKPGSNRISHQHLAMAFLTVFTLFSFSAFFFFFYLRREEIPTSENLLLALVFVAVTLFLANKNRGLINHSVSVLKHSWDENAKRFRFCKTNGGSKPVQWFIGSDPNPNKARKEKKIIREGVEFYSNGDFYEGEFHKGKCNGSGAIGSMGGTMGMGLRGGLEEADTRVNIDKDRGMGMGFIDSTQGTLMLGSGAMGRAMALECKLALMVAAMLVNSSMALSMAMVATILEMEIDMQENILETKSMDLGSIILLMVIVTRVHGMKAGSRAMVSILFEMATQDVAAGKAAENAVNLRRVDEHVNKAVMAANRAATAARVAAVKAVQNRMDGKFCDTNV